MEKRKIPRLKLNDISTHVDDNRYPGGKLDGNIRKITLGGGGISFKWHMYYTYRQIYAILTHIEKKTCTSIEKPIMIIKIDSHRLKTPIHIERCKMILIHTKSRIHVGRCWIHGSIAAYWNQPSFTVLWTERHSGRYRWEIGSMYLLLARQELIKALASGEPPIRRQIASRRGGRKPETQGGVVLQQPKSSRILSGFYRWTYMFLSMIILGLEIPFSGIGYNIRQFLWLYGD